MVAEGIRRKFDALEPVLDERSRRQWAGAEAMAVGCRTLFQTDLAVSTVGIAGPGGGSADRPVGLVYVGLAWEGGVTSVYWSWLSTRPEVQSRTAKLALNQVRLRLLGE